MDARWMIAILFLAMAQSVWGQPARIMPLGDSWTSGYGQFVSYRYDLWQELNAAGFDFDIVGGNVATDGTPNLDWYPEYLNGFDQDHEGYSGYTTSRLLDATESAAATYQPDIVLLWAGTNDIWARGSRAVSTAALNIREMVFKLRSSVPGVTVLLALNPPYEGPYATVIGELNEAIAEVGAQLDQPDSPVILVDHHTGYNISEMTWDGVHQNRTGEAWIAANWIEILEKILPKAEPFEINGGHSGAWFNPETSGQGLLLDVEPRAKFLFLSWFTYTVNEPGTPGDQHWFTAQGEYEGNTAILPIYESLGGQFGAATPVETLPVGELMLQFEDCERGNVTYVIEPWQVEGAFPIERVVPGSENVCQQYVSEGDGAPDHRAGADGGWYDPTQPGQGLLLDVRSGGLGTDFLFAAWFTYGNETESGQRWLTAQGELEGADGSMEIYESRGGIFDQSQLPTTTPVGDMSIYFTDCNHATLNYALPGDELGGLIELQRLLPKEDACDLSD